MIAGGDGGDWPDTGGPAAHGRPANGSNATTLDDEPGIKATGGPRGVSRSGGLS